MIVRWFISTLCGGLFFVSPGAPDGGAPPPPAEEKPGELPPEEAEMLESLEMLEALDMVEDLELLMDEP